jgi:hypothetical protein
MPSWIWFHFLLMQAADRNASSTFWPVTGAGWVALVSSVIALASALIGGLWSYFKVLGHIDGAMKRVSVLENWKTQEEGRELEKTLAYERMVNAQEHLLQEIGRATAEAKQCGVDTEQLGTRIETKLEAFMAEFRVADRRSGDRLMRLETLIDSKKGTTS